MTETINGIEWLYAVVDGTAEITGIQKTTAGAVTIPSTLGGRPVKSIGWVAFAGCHALTSVTIGNGVEGIRNGAFKGCRALVSVTIPDGVTWIGDWAFSDCSALKVVSLPRRFEGKIDESVFSDCAKDLKIEYR